MGHSFASAQFNLYDEYWWCKVTRDIIYSFHMPAFFVIAGFVYHPVSNYIGYIKKKIIRLCIPYFAVRIVSEFIANGFFRSREMRLSFWKDMFFYAGNGWFLYTMFFMLLFYPFADSILKNKRRFLIAACLSVLAAALQEVYRIPYLRIDRIAMYLPYFLIGRYVRKYEKQNLLLGKKFIYSILFIGANALLLCDSFPFLLCFVAKILAGICGSYIMLGFALCINRCTIGDLFAWLGENSLALFLLPSYGIYAFLNFLLGIMQIRSSVLIVLFYCFGQIVCCSLIIFLFRKNKIACILLGIRYEGTLTLLKERGQ